MNQGDKKIILLMNAQKKTALPNNTHTKNRTAEEDARQEQNYQRMRKNNTAKQFARKTHSAIPASKNTTERL